MSPIISLVLSSISFIGVNCDHVLNEPKVALNSLDDIEMLTDLLLWKHNYFKTYSKSDPSEDNDIKSMLLSFIENFNYNKLIESNSNSSSVKTIDKSLRNCDNIDSNLIKKFENRISANRIRGICEVASTCKTPNHLLELINTTATKPITESLSQSIVRLCPLVLFQLQDHECNGRSDSKYSSPPLPILANRSSAASVWGYGILFVTIVSFCSLSGVAILPLLTKSAYEMMLTLFEGLAVGSLVGSAIFHLIPQAFQLSTSGSHAYLSKALIIFGGIYLFFWSERIMKMVVEYRRGRKLNSHSDSEYSSTELETPEQLITQKQVYFRDLDIIRNSDNITQINKTSNREDVSQLENDNIYQSNCVEDLNDGDKFTSDLDIDEPINDNNLCDKCVELIGIKRPEPMILESMARENSRSNSFTLRHGHSHGAIERTEIATVAWMIILGDGLHNFIDGITIGAAFSQSILEGISISVAVICEEFPHELGDFAVLISSGMTLREALGYNFISACTCYLGLVFGIILGDLADASPYVFALAGGMFLYIALVNMMGELTTAFERARVEGRSETVKVFALQNIGILLGVFTLFLLAKYGEKINFR